MPVAKRSSRIVLTRERILRAAMRLIDVEGLANLTMRRLADELGVRPVSIYRHVPDKAAVMSGVVELMLAEIRHPAVAGDWRADMRIVMHSYRDAVRTHPNIAEISHLYMSPDILYPHYEQDLQTFVRAGFDLEEAQLAFSALRSFTSGFTRLRPTTLSPPSSEAFPISAAAQVQNGAGDQRAFEYGLDRLLDGIEAHFRAGKKP